MALMVQLGEHCTGIAKVVGSNTVQSLKMLSGLFSNSVMATFASIIISICLCDLMYTVGLRG